MASATYPPPVLTADNSMASAAYPSPPSIPALLTATAPYPVGSTVKESYTVLKTTVRRLGRERDGGKSYISEQCSYLLIFH